ncbi:MAG TPA: EmrB/QacA family drug resistance transporter, partial [Verrucomicrobiae bacterium]
GIDSVDAAKRAMAMIAGQMQAQAGMLSYLDVFEVLMVASVFAACLTVFLRKMDLAHAKPGH